jgi:hypothetical protein
MMVIPTQRIGIAGRLLFLCFLHETELRDPVLGDLRLIMLLATEDVKELARYKLTARSTVSSWEHLAVGL